MTDATFYTTDEGVFCVLCADILAQDRGYAGAASYPEAGEGSDDGFITLSNDNPSDHAPEDGGGGWRDAQEEADHENMVGRCDACAHVLDCTEYRVPGTVNLGYSCPCAPSVRWPTIYDADGDDVFSSDLIIDENSGEAAINSIKNAYNPAARTAWAGFSVGDPRGVQLAMTVTEQDGKLRVHVPHPENMAGNVLLIPVPGRPGTYDVEPY